MALKTTKTTRARKAAKPRKRKPKPKPVLQRATHQNPAAPLKRTSMWLGEDLLKASAKEAARVGMSRALWVQITLRKALGMPVINLEPPAPEPTDSSVFG